MSCAGDRLVFYQDTFHDPPPSPAHNSQGDKLQVGKGNSKGPNYCHFPQCCPIITMILGFGSPSEMFSPVWLQARLPALVRVLGGMDGDWGQHSCKGGRTSAPLGTTVHSCFGLHHTICTVRLEKLWIFQISLLFSCLRSHFILSPWL